MKKEIQNANGNHKMFTFAIRNLIVILMLTGMIVMNAKAQNTQLKRWTIPGYQIGFNPSPTVNTLPVSSSTLNVMNCMHDASGDLLFYATDQGANGVNLYDKDGNLIDTFADPSFTGFLGFGQELSIVPMPGSCSKYYLITTVYNAFSSDNVYLPVYAIIDMSLPSISSSGKGALIYDPAHPSSNLYHNLVGDEQTAAVGNANDYTSGWIHWNYISGLSVAPIVKDKGKFVVNK